MLSVSQVAGPKPEEELPTTIRVQTSLGFLDVTHRGDHAMATTDPMNPELNEIVAQRISSLIREMEEADWRTEDIVLEHILFNRGHILSCGSGSRIRRARRV